MKYFVTGSTGFIGRALCDALLANGHHVTQLARRDVSRSGPVIVHDLCDPLPTDLSLEGFDAVLHLAGIAHQRAATPLYRAVNESASIALAARAARHGVRRFVFLSSVKAMGPAPDAMPRAESAVTAPEGAYAASKRRAEIALARMAVDSGMQLVSLRPALVYGAGVGGNLGALVSWMRRGLPLVPQAGARSMVSRDDLVRLLVDIVTREDVAFPPGDAVWNVTDGEAYSTQRLMLALTDALPRSAPRWVMPSWCWRCMGAGIDLRHGYPAGTTAAAMLGSELYDSSRVRAATGWRPRECFEDVAPAILEAART